MQRHARGDARAAVRDELAAGSVGQRLVPGRVQRARDPARDAVDRVRLAAPARGQPRVDDDELVAARRSSSALDRVAVALARRRTSPARSLLAAARAGRATRRGRSRRRRRGRSGAAATTAARLRRASRRRRRRRRRRSRPRAAARGEVAAAGQRMAPAAARRRREVALDVEERGAGDVRLEVGARARSRGRRATSGSRRTGSAPVTADRSAVAGCRRHARVVGSCSGSHPRTDRGVPVRARRRRCSRRRARPVPRSRSRDPMSLVRLAGEKVWLLGTVALLDAATCSRRGARPRPARSIVPAAARHRPWSSRCRSATG